MDIFRIRKLLKIKNLKEIEGWAKDELGQVTLDPNPFLNFDWPIS